MLFMRTWRRTITSGEANMLSLKNPHKKGGIYEVSAFIHMNAKVEALY